MTVHSFFDANIAFRCVISDSDDYGECVTHFARYHNDMFSCTFDRLTNECNSTAAVIFTVAQAKIWEPLLATVNCSISKQFADSFNTVVLRCVKILFLVIV